MTLRAWRFNLAHSHNANRIWQKLPETCWVQVIQESHFSAAPCAEACAPGTFMNQVKFNSGHLGQPLLSTCPCQDPAGASGCPNLLSELAATACQTVGVCPTWQSRMAPLRLDYENHWKPQRPDSFSLVLSPAAHCCACRAFWHEHGWWHLVPQS